MNEALLAAYRLREMLEAGQITEAEYDAACAELSAAPDEDDDAAAGGDDAGGDGGDGGGE